MKKKVDSRRVRQARAYARTHVSRGSAMREALLEESVLEEPHLVEGPLVPRARSRHRYLAPVRTYAICKSCHAPCCRVSKVVVSFSFAEMHKVACERTERPWVVTFEHAPYFRPPHTRGTSRPNGARVRRSPLGARRRSTRLIVNLAKKPDGSCIHARRDGMCSVYAKRPHACKAWFCGRGTWDDIGWRHLCTLESKRWAPVQPIRTEKTLQGAI